MTRIISILLATFISLNSFAVDDSFWQSETQTKVFIWKDMRMSYKLENGVPTVQFQIKDKDGKRVYKNGLGFVEMQTKTGKKVKFFINGEGTKNELYDGFFVYTKIQVSLDQVKILSEEEVTQLKISGLGYTNTVAPSFVYGGAAKLKSISKEFIGKYKDKFLSKEKVDLAINRTKEKKITYTRSRIVAYGPRENANLVANLHKVKNKVKLVGYIDLTRHCLNADSKIEITFQNGKKINLTNSGEEGCSSAYGAKARFISNIFSKEDLELIKSGKVKSVKVIAKTKTIILPKVYEPNSLSVQFKYLMQK